MNIIRIIQITAVTTAFFMFGCGQRTGLNVNAGGGNITSNDPFNTSNLFGNGGTSPSGSLNTECPANLAAVVSIESHSSMPLPLNAPITYKIQAIGCSGKYALQDNRSAVFTNSTTVQRYYNQAGQITESFTIHSVDAANTKVLQSTTLTARITVGASAPNNQPPVAGAPTCEIMRKSAVTANGATLKFGINLYGGTTTVAQLSDGIAISGDAMGGKTVDVYPGTDGLYRVFGYVSGPGGTNFCQTSFVPPKCQIEMANFVWNSTDVKLTLPPGIVEATVQGQAIAIGDVTLARTLTNKVTFGPGPTTGRVIKAEGLGPVFPFGRDKVACETAPFNLPPPPFAGAIISWISEADSKVEILPDRIRLYTGNYYPMFGFQILGVRKDLAGNVTEEVVVNISRPFGSSKEFNSRKWAEFTYQSLGWTSDFSSLLADDAHKVNLPVHTQQFAYEDYDPHYDSSLNNAVDLVNFKSNTGTVSITTSTTAKFAVSVEHTATWSGYFQIAICNPQIMPCRY